MDYRSIKIRNKYNCNIDSARVTFIAFIFFAKVNVFWATQSASILHVTYASRNCPIRSAAFQKLSWIKNLCMARSFNPEYELFKVWYRTSSPYLNQSDIMDGNNPHMIQNSYYLLLLFTLNRVSPRMSSVETIRGRHRCFGALWFLLPYLSPEQLLANTDKQIFKNTFRSKFIAAMKSLDKPADSSFLHSGVSSDGIEERRAAW